MHDDKLNNDELQKDELNADLMAFLKNSPTPFHAVEQMGLRFTAAGFSQLDEEEAWDIKPGKYFVTRNDSSIVAFVSGKQNPIESGFRMVAAHTDSPCLKVKPRPEKTTHSYLQLGVEVYGGVLLNPWFDRDLSLAGRVVVETDSQGNDSGTTSSCIEAHLINFEQPVAIIPSLAIHLDREANSSRSINAQKDIVPIIMQGNKTQSLSDLITARVEAGQISFKQILEVELSFYDVQPPSYVGLNQEFIAGARLDNLLSCYLGMISLLEADDELCSLLVCNDHEEVGSASATGAQGPFLQSVLERLIREPEDRTRALAKSLLISTDNAHGIHPNFADKHDANHGPILNQGPVIKVNSNQRYATNSETAGFFRWLSSQADVPCQTFVSRSDMACGSTIGPITATQIGVKTLDLGLPTFAMHSIREVCGSDDPSYLYKVLKRFYQQPDLRIK